MERLEELYKKRIPIEEIVKQVGFSKATIYRHLEKSGVKIRSVSESKTGIRLTDVHKNNISKGLLKIDAGRKPLDLKNGYKRLTNDLTYIMGVMFGDGYVIEASGIGLESIDKDFVDAFYVAIRRQFGIKSKIYHTKKSPLLDWRNGKTYKRSDTYILRASSVLLRDFIKKYKSIFNPHKLNENMKVCFLRGLWDSEGTVNQSGVANTVHFTHNDELLCKMFQSILLEITDIPAKIIKNNQQGNYVLYFYRKEYIKSFYDIIKPTIRRKRTIFEKIINS